MATLVAPNRTAISFNSLRPLLLEARARAARLQRPVVVSASEPLARRDPLPAFGRARSLTRAYWEHEEPDGTHVALAAIGAAHRISTSGPERFAEADRVWRDLIDAAVVEGADGTVGTGPLLTGGFRFDPLRPRTVAWERFPDAMLFLPRLALTAVDGESRLTLNAVLDSESDPWAEAAALMRLRDWLLRLPAYEDGPEAPRPSCPAALEDLLPADEWRRRVGLTAHEIREGRYAKVVLARATRLGLSGVGDVATTATRAVRRLRATYPGSFVFAVAVPANERGPRADQAIGDASRTDEHIFLGASPERLLRLSGREVQTAVLAGSTRRGDTEDQDNRLGAALLASAKDRHEHQVVAAALRTALDPLCDRFEMAAVPTLLRLRTVQHLYTPIRGRLHDACSPLELLARLHPTPAVGGYPRQAALETIRAREGLDRGWYAAPVGWLDGQGRGEFAVALRSALLYQPQATAGTTGTAVSVTHGEKAVGSNPVEALLFAGCGIMGDSDPASEYEESLLKLQPMRAALAE